MNTIYLPTDVTWIYLIGLAIVILLTLFSAVAFFADKKKAEKAGEPFRIIDEIYMPAFVTVLIGMVFFAMGGMITTYLNTNNMAENTKTAYSVEKVTFQKLPKNDAVVHTPEGKTALVTKDGKTYSVIITQNSETYEPTIISYDTGLGLPELSK